MINPAAYDAFLEGLEDAMARARMLGLWRTAQQLHQALNEGRSERFEAQPTNVPVVEFRVGPVTEQKL